MLVLIISISTHLFIHLTTQKKKKKEIIQNIYRYIVKNKKKIIFFLHSKKRILDHRYSGTEYLHLFFQYYEKIYHIVSLSYYIQLKHWLIWYTCISSQNDKKKPSSIDLVLHCICMTVVPCTKVLKDFPLVWSYKIFEYYQHQPKMV